MEFTTIIIGIFTGLRYFQAKKEAIPKLGSGTTISLIEKASTNKINAVPILNGTASELNT
ncbi:hypothetical protein [Bacillus pakistanensis]|uniref:hypothetical protein n=1 Tax=Rossellomorea pakistanensis TaxID=992288 RepID=UPI001965D12A|nr:hypothetical protein [Bacillus pakistanensis]